MEKKRLRLRTPFRIILSIIAIIVIVTLYFPISVVLKLTSHNYSFFSSIEIYKLGLTKDILKTEYSDVLDKGVLDENFNINYLEYTSISQILAQAPFDEPVIVILIYCAD